MAQITYTDQSGSFKLDIAPAVFAALESFVAAETTQVLVDGVPQQARKFENVAVLLFGHFAGLFNSVLEKHPSVELLTAFAEKTTAEAKIKQLQESAVIVTPAVADAGVVVSPTEPSGLASKVKNLFK